MQTLTAFLAILGSVLAISLTPVYALVVYIISFLSYPYGAGLLSIGTIDFSVSRVIILVLFARVILTRELTKDFRVMWLDRLVVIVFAAEIAAGVVTSEAARIIEYRGGDFCDMALPYFVVRLVVRRKEDYLTILKAIAWGSAILSLVAFYECLTGVNLLRLGRPLPVPEIRMRVFHRAQVTFRHAIYFGVFTGMAGAVCLGLVKNVGSKMWPYLLLVGLIFLGAFSSMSSGGQFALVGAVVFVVLYQFRRSWRGLIITGIVLCVLVEIISNRHFYNVIDRFAFNASTAWYRTRLFEVAFFEGGMTGHWVTGYGAADPGWGPKIDGRGHTDMVNHYLLELARYGLVGFIPFCLVILTAVKNLFRGFWSLARDEDTWLLWCIGAGLFSVLMAFNSVSLFEQPMILLFMMFGFCATVPPLLAKKQPCAVVRTLRPSSLEIPGLVPGSMPLYPGTVR
jgi:hypothetical protein